MKKSLLMIVIFFWMLQADLTQYDIILVRNDLPHDWAIAQSYAHKQKIPILSTSPDRLDPNVEKELIGYKNAGFKKLLIIGGEKAISIEIQERLNDMGFITHRISEGDRYGTSARVALELFPESKTAIIVNGESINDLLIAERLSIRTESPILLVKNDKIPETVMNTIKSLGINKIYVVSDVNISIPNIKIEKIKDIEPYGKNWTMLALISMIIALSILLAIYINLKREKIPYVLLTSDEEKIIRTIEMNGGEITQDKLPALTNFSRPKISRLISELVNRGILEKEPFGKTQKIKIKRKFR